MDVSAFKARLASQAEKQLLRKRCVLQSQQGSWVQVNGKRQLSFTSSDYLGLSSDKRVIKALQTGANCYGVGQSASQQLTGYTKAHEALEAALADRVGRSRAILFNSGYHANLGVLGALVQPHDAIFQDKLNHASLIDAAILTRAKTYRYQHLDITHLAALLTKQSKQHNFFVTESIFSMDGQIAPLKEMSVLAAQHNALLYVDEAHAFGVLGQHGAGAVTHLGLSEKAVPLIMGTLGKACGVSGAFVAGDPILIENLMQFARTLRYSIAMPAPLACAGLAGLEIMAQESWRFEHLQHLIRHFTAQARLAKLPIIPSMTPIQAVLLGSNTVALAVADQLANEGILALAIRPPTVPENTARVRINLTVHHSLSDVDRLIDVLERQLTHAIPP